MTGTDGGVEV